MESYTKAQHLFRTDEQSTPEFDDLLELDLATIEPSLAGPRRPQDRVPVQNLSRAFRAAYADRFVSESVTTEQDVIRYGSDGGGRPDPDPVSQHEDLRHKQAHGRHNGHVNDVKVQIGDTQVHMTDGSVAIAAITSCTNTF